MRPLPTCTLLEMFPKEKLSVMRPRRTTEHSADWALDQVLILRVGKYRKRKMTFQNSSKIRSIKGHKVTSLKEITIGRFTLNCQRSYS